MTPYSLYFKEVRVECFKHTVSFNFFPIKCQLISKHCICKIVPAMDFAFGVNVLENLIDRKPILPNGFNLFFFNKNKVWLAYKL